MAEEIYFVDINDAGKISKIISRVIGKTTIKVSRNVKIASKRITEYIIRSIRSRLSRAPYNYRSPRPGKWSRTGGRPSEKSLRLIRKGNYYAVLIENEGNGEGLPPTEYLKLRVSKDGRGRPRAYIDESVEKAISMIDNFIEKSLR